MSTSRVPGPLTRLARRHGVTRSPLRRSTDRVEAGVTAGAAVLVLCAALLAAVLTMGLYQRAQTEAATQAALQISVTAVLLTDAAAPPGDTSEQGGAGQATAVARWPLPNGQQRTAPPVGVYLLPRRRPDIDLDRSAWQPRRPTQDIGDHDRRGLRGLITHRRLGVTRIAVGDHLLCPGPDQRPTVGPGLGTHRSSLEPSHLAVTLSWMS